MEKKGPLAFTTITLVFAIPFILVVHAGEAELFRTISIPKEEHGYCNFASVVIASQDDLDAFLKTVSNAQGMTWNNRADFDKGIREGRVDFDKEALILLRHTEGSGSTQVAFRDPIVKEKKLICQIDRKKSEVGITVMAFYCFALAVDKAAVAEVELRVSGSKPALLSLRKETEPDKPNAGDGQ